ncbi:MAG: peptidoglycan DD-metalloendopeptidase family protein [Bacteroidales bacterium]|nr:peptidoglycan DD-metalloendopeptidase family protein [Bacteroidales bacterium]
MNRKRTITLIIILSLLLAATLVFIVIDHQKNHRQIADMETPDQDPEWIPVVRYGIVVDTLEMHEYIVKSGETLSVILERIGIGSNIANQIYNNCKDVMDTRKIRAGQPYIVLKMADTLAAPLYLVYENSKIQYTVFELFEPYKVYQEENEITYVHDTIACVITSSLWNAIVADKGDPAIAAELADVYQWTIDFFGIQKGDEFFAIYEKKYVEGNYIGLNSIEAALFKHGGKNYYAFYYQQDSAKKGEYFDETGQSLRREFLKAPLNYSRISSKFSNSRYHPVLKIYRPHHGVDYAAPAGTPVYSVGNGKVVEKGYDKGGGNYLKIKHNSIYTTVYMHLKGFATGIAQGTSVSQGQLIGYVGSTGLSTGPHLDFRVYKNGTPINPLSMQSPPAEPISEAMMPSYLEFIAPVKEALGRD